MTAKRKRWSGKCPASLHSLDREDAVCDLCSRRYVHHLDMAKISATISVPHFSHSSQTGLGFDFGYAWVRVHTYGAEGRREGVDDRATPSDRYDFGQAVDYADLGAWITKILITGRTCEVGRGVGLRQLREVPRSETCNYSWLCVVSMIDGTEMCSSGRPLPTLNLNPDYQRDHVWTASQQQRYLGHVFEGGAQTAIFIQRYRTDSNVPKGMEYLDCADEVIDGKQRLMAIYEFMKGCVGAELSDGRVIWYKDFDEVDRRGLNVQLSHVDLSRSERLRFYLKLNRGGTVHSDDEIAKIRRLLEQAMSVVASE